jgi:deoxyribonuclease-4
MMKKVPLLGAHISIVGGLHNALLAGKSIGATTIQVFTANQRSWASKTLTNEEVCLFKKTLDETNLQCIMSHGSYLINLGSPRVEVRQKSIEAFRQEIKRCLMLGITFLNFHPGASLDNSREESLNAIIEALLSCQDCLPKNVGLTLLLETAAGQGSTIGARFEELAYIIERVEKKIPVGVCMDTCHVFAAGYDLRTKQALTATLDEFDKVIGLSFLRAMHLNDSDEGLACHKDRHRLIGEGMIGKEGFSAIMQEPRLSSLPKYLETPGDLEIWQREIAWLLCQMKG